MKMNREIKFRAKNTITGDWIYGGYYKHLKRTPSSIGDSIKEDDYYHLIIKGGYSGWNMPKPLECLGVDKETVGQYTGLRDVNNKEIYEGDIIQCDNLLWCVNYDMGNYTMGFVLDAIKHHESCVHHSTWENGKVIGNIHDNPELL